jgi:hypothetical protein
MIAKFAAAADRRLYLGYLMQISVAVHLIAALEGLQQFYVELE